MKVIVVGAGSIGRRHIGNLLKLDRDLQVGVAEPSETSRDAVRETWGLEPLPSLESALERESYDAALVCTPNHLHIPQAKILAEAGCHLFVEKPLCLDREEALGLVPILERSGVVLMVGCNLRFHPGVSALVEVLRSGKIGRPLYARAQFAHYLPNWRPGQNYRRTYSARKEQGGGILLDDIHEPDYLCWLLGDVTRVSGFLPTIGDLDVDVEDVADYIMWHGDRLYSHVHADYLRRDKIRGCELVGTEGSVVWQSRKKNPEIVDVKLFDATLGKWKTVFFNDTYDLNAQYLDEIDYFFGSIQEGRKPMNGVDQAIRLMNVLDKVRQADRSGLVQEVRQDEG